MAERVGDSYQVNIQNGAPGLGAPTQDVLFKPGNFEMYIMLVGFHTSFLCALSNATTSITDLHDNSCLNFWRCMHQRYLLRLVAAVSLLGSSQFMYDLTWAIDRNCCKDVGRLKSFLKPKNRIVRIPMPCMSMWFCFSFLASQPKMSSIH